MLPNQYKVRTVLRSLDHERSESASAVDVDRDPWRRLHTVVARTDSGASAIVRHARLQRRHQVGCPRLEGRLDAVHAEEGTSRRAELSGHPLRRHWASGLVALWRAHQHADARQAGRKRSHLYAVAHSRLVFADPFHAP